MSKDETVTEQYDRDDNHFQFAEANAPIDYEPYRQSYKLPEWKDTKGRYAKRPSRDLGTDRNTDKSVYHSRDIMEQEWERIWSKVWLLVGHLNDIPKPNAFMKVDRAHESVLIVRGEGDSIRAMYNVCQHRGARLVEQDFGTTKKFVCPFHMWEFSSNGELLKITDRETFREEALCHNLDLPEVRSAVYRGWIFITFNDDAMIGVLTVLRDIGNAKDDYKFVDEARRAKAAAAAAKALPLILKLQVEIGGKKTVWVQQYDGLQKVLISKVEEIKLRMNQLYEQWLQK